MWIVTIYNGRACKTVMEWLAYNKNRLQERTKGRKGERERLSLSNKQVQDQCSGNMLTYHLTQKRSQN